MINIQPIEKMEHGNGAELDVHSIFPTIQGEGPLTGHPAIFVRLAGCNLQCPQCDTVYTGPNVKRMSVSAIVQAINKLHEGPRLVVITGGEPFRQNIAPLALALVDEDYPVQVETNGTMPIPLGFPVTTGPFGTPGAWVVVSPKLSRVQPSVRAAAVAWKYVLNHDSVDDDGLPIQALHNDAGANRRIARPLEDFPRSAIYVQPADAFQLDNNFGRQIENAKNVQAAVKSCMLHGYTMQLQTHKLLNME